MSSFNNKNNCSKDNSSDNNALNNGINDNNMMNNSNNKNNKNKNNKINEINENNNLKSLNNAIDTGITSEIYTVKSTIRLIDIINKIIQLKSDKVIEWMDTFLNDDFINKNDSILIIGTYLTGIGIAKSLTLKNYSNITLLDIYPHLNSFIHSDIGVDFSNNCVDLDYDDDDLEGIDLIYENMSNENLNLKYDNIKFSSDFDLIKSSDIVIDTTGFGGLSKEQSGWINSKLFLIEDPVAEDNDIYLANKNNICDRIDAVSADYKAILKTKGLNTKTSGTMTFLINLLKEVICDLNNKDGVLYSVCKMNFFEEIIFKEKNIDKFMNMVNSNAITVSTIIPFDCDEIILEYINKLDSKIIEY